MVAVSTVFTVVVLSLLISRSLATLPASKKKARAAEIGPRARANAKAVFGR